MLKNEDIHPPAQSPSASIVQLPQAISEATAPHPQSRSICPYCHCSSPSPHASVYEDPASNNPLTQQRAAPEQSEAGSNNPVVPERSEGSPANNPLIQQSSNPLPAITVAGLADLLGCGRLDIRDYANRLGLRFARRRVGARYKRIAALTASDAALLIAAYQSDLAAGPLPPDPELEPVGPDPDIGFVYLVQLEPELDPGRFKAGFSAKPWSRIHDFLTSAPFGECLATWPARRQWEATAIAALTQNAIQIREEVYRNRDPDLQTVVAAGDRFFATMPNPAASAPERRKPQSASAAPAVINPIARSAKLPPPDPPPHTESPPAPWRGAPPQCSSCGPPQESTPTRRSRHFFPASGPPPDAASPPEPWREAPLDPN